MELSADQKNAIRDQIPDFKKFLEGEEAKEALATFEKRAVLFKRLLEEKALPNLTEEQFSEVMKSLWALSFWSNKDYKIKQLLETNGFGNIRGNLWGLLHGTASIESRYDSFRANVRGFGPAMITEILVTMFPDKYCLWNEPPKRVLPYLKMRDTLPPAVFKGELRGKDYAQCIEVLRLLGKELERNGVKGVGPEASIGFSTIDMFLWSVWETKSDEIKGERKVAATREGKRVGKEWLGGTPVVGEIKSHEAAQAMLLEIGNLVGFDTFTADPGKDPGNEFYDEADDNGVMVEIPRTLGELATLNQVPAFARDEILDSVRRIDVIWFKEDFPDVCFEVEHTTNVKDGLLRQYQISRHVQNARFFVIAPEDQRAKFEREVQTYPFNQIRQRYTFKSYQELIEFYREAQKYHEIKARFGL